MNIPTLLGSIVSGLIWDIPVLLFAYVPYSGIVVYGLLERTFSEFLRAKAGVGGSKVYVSTWRAFGS